MLFRSRRQSSSDYISKDLKNLWLLRIIIELDAHKGFLREHDFMHDDLARELGFDNYVDNSSSYNRNIVLSELRQNLTAIEKHAPQIKSESQLCENISKLGQALELNDVEILILYFSVIARTEGHFEEAIGSMGSLNVSSIEKLFSICLGIEMTVNLFQQLNSPSFQLILMFIYCYSPVYTDMSI
jgi:hypothetical protein